jgi:hypothetical protein
MHVTKQTSTRTYITSERKQNGEMVEIVRGPNKQEQRGSPKSEQRISNSRKARQYFAYPKEESAIGENGKGEQSSGVYRSRK